MKHIFKSLALRLRPLLMAFISIYFDKKYLTGRHFDLGFEGYFWALKSIWAKNILRLSRAHPWPTGMTCNLSNAKNITFHPDDLNNFQSPGIYIQNFKGKIHIGRGSYIGPNVGLITANHLLDDLDKHGEGRDIFIGDRCWLGMNAVVLPGVKLGPQTIVAAGAVVTRSFPQGRILIGGVPAKVIKSLGSLSD